MRKINVQKALVISVYLIVILGSFWLSMKEVRMMTSSISVEEYMQEENPTDIPEGAYKQDTGEQLQETEVYDQLQSYQVYYQNEFTKQLLPVIIEFSSIFITSSIIFWMFMHRLQKKERMHIAKDLTNLKEYQQLPDADPILKQAYLTIQKSYEQHFEDYKRLHSYLSHEQKNALALLQSHLELHEYERCKENIASLHQGIEDLLTISDSSKEDTLYPVDVVEICAKVCDDYHHQAKIIFEFEEEDCFIKAKERWIYRLVANLVDNAIKYGKGNPIEVSVWLDQEEVKVSVKDYGIGIDAKQQERIFWHHVRINDLNKDGYGIGLSLVRHVVNLSNGTIFVDSKPQEGTTITIAFPRYLNDS